VVQETFACQFALIPLHYIVRSQEVIYMVHSRRQLAFAGSLQPAGADKSGNHPDDTADTVCIANIGPKERRKRLRFGVITLAVSAVIAAVLIVSGLPAFLRLPLFLPLAAGASGFFQWREKT
jgi:hypothetical protein